MEENWTQNTEWRTTPDFIPASKEKRFANFLIDYAVLLLCIFTFISFSTFLSPNWFASYAGQMDSIKGRIFMTVVYALYYFVVETALCGKSIGKMMTGTRVVKVDGTEAELEDFLKRSFSRIVPFEAFSFLGASDGWHDRWSDTMVIDEGKSNV